MLTMAFVIHVCFAVAFAAWNMLCVERPCNAGSSCNHAEAILVACMNIYMPTAENTYALLWLMRT